MHSCEDVPNDFGELETRLVERPKPQLVVINEHTARDREANKTLAEFAADTGHLSTGCERMAAYFIMVFDDEGNPISKLYCGDMFPISSVLLPEIIRDAAKVRVHE